MYPLTALERETKEQGRIRAALAGMPYSGGAGLQFNAPMDYALIADNLEKLRNVIVHARDNEIHQEAKYRKLQAGVNAIRNLFLEPKE